MRLLKYILSGTLAISLSGCFTIFSDLNKDYNPYEKSCTEGIVRITKTESKKVTVMEDGCDFRLPDPDEKIDNILDSCIIRENPGEILHSTTLLSDESAESECGHEYRSGLYEKLKVHVSKFEKLAGEPNSNVRTFSSEFDDIYPHTVSVSNKKDEAYLVTDTTGDGKANRFCAFRYGTYNEGAVILCVETYKNSNNISPAYKQIDDLISGLTQYAEGCEVRNQAFQKLKENNKVL